MHLFQVLSNQLDKQLFKVDWPPVSSDRQVPQRAAKQWDWPGGFTLHMTGYAPACTKSVEKGSFLDIRRRRRLLQKGYIFRC